MAPFLGRPRWAALVKSAVVVRAIRGLGAWCAGRPGRSLGFARTAKEKLPRAFSLSSAVGCRQAANTGLTVLPMRAAGASVPECRRRIVHRPGEDRLVVGGLSWLVIVVVRYRRK